MIRILCPGYRELFGEPTETYKSWVKDVAPDLVISLAIMINKTLDTPGKPDSEIQQRIRNLLSVRFPKIYLDRLNEAFALYAQNTKGHYQNYLFGKRYLMAMIVKELNSDRPPGVKMSDFPEYNFLMAYLLVIDELNSKDGPLLDSITSQSSDPLFKYKMLWLPFLNQYQFNENPHIAFELFKLLSFLKYALLKYKPYLKEYLNSMSFQDAGSFAHSFIQMISASVQFNKSDFPNDLTYIQPDQHIDDAHLRSLAINIEGSGPVTYVDIKKKPLFFVANKGYLPIDVTSFVKAIYRGPYFDLRKQTSLSKSLPFNSYSSTISKEVLEEMCFNPIMESLRCSKYDFIHFDNGSDLVPDCYYRNKKTIILVEFKAFLFPDEIVFPANNNASQDQEPEFPNFDRLKKYIDERFIEKDGKSKGVSQLANQIKKLNSAEFHFDSFFVNELVSKKVTIYPILCVDEFHFTLPGLNEYLNNTFWTLIDDKLRARFNIKKPTLINLDTFFEISLYKGNFKNVTEYIDRYWDILSKRTSKYDKYWSADDFINSMASFDELYDTRLKDRSDVAPRKNDLASSLIQRIGLTQSELDEVL